MALFGISPMDIADISARSQQFLRTLDARKSELAPTEFGWYPYGTMHNFPILERLLGEANRNPLPPVDMGPIADIGAADGDTAAGDARRDRRLPGGRAARRDAVADRRDRHDQGVDHGRRGEPTDHSARQHPRGRSRRHQDETCDDDQQRQVPHAKSPDGHPPGSVVL